MKSSDRVTVLASTQKKTLRNILNLIGEGNAGDDALAKQQMGVYRDTEKRKKYPLQTSDRRALRQVGSET
jgi:hypothetical protein